MDEIIPFNQRMGWTMPWNSSFGSDFDYDFHVTLNEVVAPVEYQLPREVHDGPHDLTGEQPGAGVLQRDGDDIFHTYSTYQRGPDLLLGTDNYRHLALLGGQGSHEFRHYDRYGSTPEATSDRPSVRASAR